MSTGRRQRNSPRNSLCQIIAISRKFPRKFPGDFQVADKPTWQPAGQLPQQPIHHKPSSSAPTSRNPPSSSPTACRAVRRTTNPANQQCSQQPAYQSALPGMTPANVSEMGSEKCFKESTRTTPPSMQGRSTSCPTFGCSHCLLCTCLERHARPLSSTLLFA